MHSMITIVGKVVHEKHHSNKTVYKVFKEVNFLRKLVVVYFQIEDGSGTIEVIFWLDSLKQKPNNIIGSMAKVFGSIR